MWQVFGARVSPELEAWDTSGSPSGESRCRLPKASGRVLPGGFCCPSSSVRHRLTVSETAAGKCSQRVQYAREPDLLTDKAQSQEEKEWGSRGFNFPEGKATWDVQPHPSQSRMLSQALDSRRAPADGPSTEMWASFTEHFHLKL